MFLDQKVLKRQINRITNLTVYILNYIDYDVTFLGHK